MGHRYKNIFYTVPDELVTTIVLSNSLLCNHWFFGLIGESGRGNGIVGNLRVVKMNWHFLQIFFLESEGIKQVVWLTLHDCKYSVEFWTERDFEAVERTTYVCHDHLMSTLNFVCNPFTNIFTTQFVNQHRQVHLSLMLPAFPYPWFETIVFWDTISTMCKMCKCTISLVY